MTTLKQFIVAMVVFLALDMLWLGVVAKNLYSRYLGHLMAAQVNWFAAIAFYILFVIGLIYFVLTPALSKESWRHALLAGAFYGLITYATYDLTNMATMKDWPTAITFIDLIWGAVLSGATAVLSYFILQKLS